MSCHESFYVFPRVLKSGNVVFYYQTYIIAITGHLTIKILERYSHIDLTCIEDVNVMQSALI